MVTIIPIPIFLLATIFICSLARLPPNFLPRINLLPPNCSESEDDPNPAKFSPRPIDPLSTKPWWIGPIRLPITVEPPAGPIIVKPPPKGTERHANTPSEIEISITNKTISKFVDSENGLENAAKHTIELLGEQKEISQRIESELNHALRAEKLLKLSKQFDKEEKSFRILNYSILSFDVVQQDSNEKILLSIIDILQDYRKNLCEKPWCEGIREVSSSKVVEAWFNGASLYLENDQLRTNKKLSEIQREHGVPKENILESGGFGNDEEDTVLHRSEKLTAAYAIELNTSVQLYPLVRLHPYLTRRNSEERDPFGLIAVVLATVNVSDLKIKNPPLYPFGVLVLDFSSRH